MAFTPRTFPEILFDMVAYVQSTTNLTDFTPGSVIRTLLEASALEDDEQYFQMVQLLDMFSLSTATGADLDRRMADFRLYRLPARRAFGKVIFTDTGVKTTQVAVDTFATNLSVTVLDSTGFPTTGFPYVIRVGEGTGHPQDLDVTANNPNTGVFTLSASTPLIYDISVSERVTLVTGAVSRLVAATTSVEAPATALSAMRRYSTMEAASIVAGNVYSNKVLVQSDSLGASGNTGVNTITKFTGGAPYTGGGVINTTAIEGGVSVEKDKEFRERGLNQLQSLSRGTPLAIKTASIGVVDPETGQRVDSANIVEDFANDTVIVYIDDGTGLVPDYADFEASTLASPVTIGNTSLVLDSSTDFPTEGTVLVYDGADSELIEYIGVSSNTLLLESAAVANHVASTVVYQVDVVEDAATLNQRRFRLNHFPVVMGTLSIFSKSIAGVWTLLVDDTDYFINNGTGEFQLADLGGVTTGTMIVAHYDYYTNLIAQVQKVLEGDLNSPNTFPGVKAAGINLRVQEATVRRINVRASITAEQGFLETDLAPAVRRAIEDYINGLKVGSSVIVAKMIEAAYTVPGVRDIVVTTPSRNVVVLEDQLPVAYSTTGTTLVVVV